MKKKELVIKIIVCIMFAMGLAMGLVYLLGPTLMPFHFAFLGKTQDQLEPLTFDLFMMMKRVIGAHFLALSFGALILMGSLVRGDVFARWALLVMVLISQSILLFASYKIHNTSLLWLLNVLEIILAFAVFFLAKSPKAAKR